MRGVGGRVFKSLKAELKRKEACKRLSNSEVEIKHTVTVEWKGD